MSDYSLFDIAGPIMIGPSSSHTAGAAKIGLIARALFGQVPQRVVFNLHGSFAQVYAGHATDKALLNGVLGQPADSPKLPKAFEIAQKEGLDYEFKKLNLGPKMHANSVKIEFWSTGQTEPFTVIGSSVGGGKVQFSDINGFAISFSCSHARQHLAIIQHNLDSNWHQALESLEVAGKLNYHQTRRSEQDTNKLMTIAVSAYPLPAAELNDLPGVTNTHLISGLAV